MKMWPIRTPINVNNFDLAELLYHINEIIIPSWTPLSYQWNNYSVVHSLVNYWSILHWATIDQFYIVIIPTEHIVDKMEGNKVSTPPKLNHWTCRSQVVYILWDNG